MDLWLPERNNRGRDYQGLWNRPVHTAVFKMDNQQGPTIEHRKLCSVLYSCLGGRGVGGRMDPCICMAESLCCPPETITTFLKFLQERIRSLGILFKALRVTISRTKTGYKPSKLLEDSGGKETS